MKLKKVARFAGRCASDLVVRVFAKAFTFGFDQASYAYHYWRWPDGSTETAKEFVIENEQRLMKTVDAWLDKHSSERNHDYWTESEVWHWARNLSDLRYKMVVNDATQAEFSILKRLEKHAMVDRRLEYCRDIVYYNELKKKYMDEED